MRRNLLKRLEDAAIDRGVGQFRLAMAMIVPFVRRLFLGWRGRPALTVVVRLIN